MRLSFCWYVKVTVQFHRFLEVNVLMVFEIKMKNRALAKMKHGINPHERSVGFQLTRN